MEGVISNFLFTSGPSVVVIKAVKGQYLEQGSGRYGSCLVLEIHNTSGRLGSFGGDVDRILFGKCVKFPLKFDTL